MLSYIGIAMENAESKYQCRINPDENWISYGIARVLHKHDSGRDFFQSLRMDSLGELNVRRQDFQEGLKSNRRLRHLSSINDGYLQPRAHEALKTNTLDLPKSLRSFHIYAADGHFHAASCHEKRDEKGHKHAIGHLYALNLRNGDMCHLALSSDGTRKKPHDMGSLKRMETSALRQGAKQGQKVLYVWDSASIDFRAWRDWKYKNAIYFLSKAKENMSREVIGKIAFDKEDPQNSGVIADEYIAAGEALRMVTYHDLETGKQFQFITNLSATVPPGLIAQLYRMRWDIEKVFDEFKNKLDETKAWSKFLNGKRMQAQFMVLTYNLLKRLHNDTQKEEPDITKTRKDKSDKRWMATTQHYENAGKQIPTWLEKLRRITQIGVVFIRWARSMFLQAASWRQSLELLRYEYAQK